VYHVELRQFPHSFCRFNLSEQELQETILLPWARGELVQLGERRWSPQQATLTVLEGPQLAMAELAMGRGWRNARRRGQDMTARLLAHTSHNALTGASPDERSLPRDSARECTAAPAAQTALAGIHDERKALVDALALELLGLLGEQPVPLARAWLLARERNPGLTPSECLALAEAALEEPR
jgi:hypothetical protein